MTITAAKLLKGPRLPSASIVQALQEQEVDLQLDLRVPSNPARFAGHKKSGAYRLYCSDLARFVALHARIASANIAALESNRLSGPSTFESASFYRHKKEVGNANWSKHMQFIKTHVYKGDRLLRVDLTNAYGSVPLEDTLRIINLFDGRMPSKPYLASRFGSGLPYPCPLSRLIFEIYIREKLLLFSDYIGSFFTDDLAFVLQTENPVLESERIIERLRHAGLSVNVLKVYIDTLETRDDLLLFGRNAVDTHLDAYGERATLKILVASAEYGGDSSFFLPDVDEEALCFDIASGGKKSVLGAGHIIKSKPLSGVTCTAFRNRALAFLYDNPFWMSDLIDVVDYGEQSKILARYSSQELATLQDEAPALIQSASRLALEEGESYTSSSFECLNRLVEQIDRMGLHNPDIAKCICKLPIKQMRSDVRLRLQNLPLPPEIIAEFELQKGLGMAQDAKRQLSDRILKSQA